MKIGVAVNGRTPPLYTGRLAPLQKQQQCLEAKGYGVGVGVGVVNHRLSLNSISAVISSNDPSSPTSKAAVAEEELLSSSSSSALSLTEIKDKCSKWKWRGHTINYFVYKGIDDDNQQQTTNSTPPPLLLVHGFGASIAHWRRYPPFHF